MGLQPERHGNHTVVRFPSRTEPDSAAELRRQLAALIKLGHTELIIDMSATAFLNGAGTGILFVLSQWLHARDGSLCLAAPTRQVEHLIEHAGLTHLVTTAPSVDDAIADSSHDQPCTYPQEIPA